MRLAASRALAMPGDRPFILWRFVMVKTLIAVAVAGAFALPVVAAASAGGDNIVIAQSGGSGADGTMKQPGTGATADSRFERLDKNHDGFISRDEAKDAAELNTRFSELDTNNDGKLSPEEYGALYAGTRGAAGTTAGTTRKGRPPRKGSRASSSTRAHTKKRTPLPENHHSSLPPDTPLPP